MSAWYQWFIAAPMMTIDLPCVLSALSANWRATVASCSRGTPVICSAQAGVYGVSSSKLAAASSPASPRATPYCATCRSNTVATSASRFSPSLPSAMRIAGTRRTSTSPPWLLAVKCGVAMPPKYGNATSTAS